MMGEAKRRRALAVPTVYHHTSTLRTNLIWMSGVIQLEGQSKGALHPDLGEVFTDAKLRRALIDFPPLAWFTTRISVPRCLLDVEVYGFDKRTGERRVLGGAQLANAISLNRMALGFRIADIPVVPWPEHYGYKTEEGRELNESARALGDDPNDWYVSEQPIDVMQVTEAWSSASIMRPKLERMSSYVADIKRMVSLCRSTPGAYIPPAWLAPRDVERLARATGIGVGGMDRPAPALGR